jgi:lysophospholipase L1-like esterase
MHRRILAFVTAVAALAALPAVAAAQGTPAQGPAARKPPQRTLPTTAAPARYYVALGDSLSQGMQPDLRGVTRNTDQGYVDDLYQAALKRTPALQVVKLGCGGDTSGSLLTGKGNERNARSLHCNRTGGSQLAAAVRFLKAHHNRGEVPLLTIDIGANDVDGCVTATNVGACVTAGTKAINTNVPKILRALKKAAPAGTKLAGMNLYDPVLGGYFAPVSSPLHGLALASVPLLKNINQQLNTDYARGGFRTADVAGAFDSYDLTTTVTWEGQQLPAAVAKVCSWTWACQTPPSGPNIHANTNGYQVIANAFTKVLGRL